jgi:hypothetical protein
VAALVDLVLSIKWWGLARLMDAERANRLQNARADDLLHEGEQAFMNGDRRLAHACWREAATVDPYNEAVWLALLKVLDSEEDRIVCLENIIAINPLNVEARRALRRELGQPEPISVPNAAPRRSSMLSPLPDAQRSPLNVLLRGLFMGIGAGLFGVVIGVVASIMWYGV